ncbi:exonuclease 1-like [Montipora foliosa]|uniref:exonuclease 1-like n=1 Tax=Montipora foliosa TaxID=591990 RepID=UPI0035F16A74
MSHKLLKVLRDKNIDCIVAPFEADAQLAYLNKNQLIDVHVVLSEDSDLLVFACCEVIYKVHLHGSCQSIQSKDIPKCLNISNYTFDLFRHMCIIAGCDYLESLHGIGIKRAHNLMKKVAAANGDVRKFFSRLPQVLGVKTLCVLGPEYLLRFDEADQMFLHQVVFDPRNLRAVPLNPILDESEAPPELQLLIFVWETLTQTQCIVSYFTLEDVQGPDSIWGSRTLLHLECDDESETTSSSAEKSVKSVTEFSTEENGSSDDVESYWGSPFNKNTRPFGRSFDKNERWRDSFSYVKT